jgi:hypothetical protein
MDTLKIQDKFRIGPTLQQGGTQTIQQSIYLTHNNPCGANQLIFQTMGLTQIRYIDLKNYLDQILASPQMRSYFEQVRIKGTEYINNPDNPQYLLRYLQALGEWAYAGFNNLPVPPDYYPGYYFKFSVYDASGCAIWDSDFPFLTITQEVGGVVYYNQVQLEANPFFAAYINLYKLSNAYPAIAYIRTNGYPYGRAVLDSDFCLNQLGLPESIMTTSSLLIDSANTRTFGIPRYGFSARSNQNVFGGIGYHCSHFMDIRTTPDEDGQTTLIESIFARLSLQEDTLFTSSIGDLQQKIINKFTKHK